ncbi:uncharacterized protein LOC17880481 [Capsella rubella]|nr:uncharacterized protein LOC17880481 [Capsella rubella]
MSEEFQESEVIFSDEYFTKKKKSDNKSSSDNYENKKGKATAAATERISSPVRIPSRTSFRCTEEMEEEEEMTPPHVIIGKRRTETQMAFSFCTLKGRDLSRHRNSVLRMTGFLEV